MTTRIFLAPFLCFLLKLSLANGLTIEEENLFTGVTFTGAVSVDNWIIESKGLPDHATESVNPNNVTEQNYAYEIPKNPVYDDSSAVLCLPMSNIALAINGVGMFNPLTEDSCDAGETEKFDNCNGHPDMQGAYHYHVDPVCVYDVTMQSVDVLLGVAFDGFPIYYNSDVNNDHLDKCHGKVTAGAYRYYMTKEWPYFLGCYRGNIVDVNLRVNNAVECGNQNGLAMCSCKGETTFYSSPTCETQETGPGEPPPPPGDDGPPPPPPPGGPPPPPPPPPGGPPPPPPPPPERRLAILREILRNRIYSPAIQNPADRYIDRAYGQPSNRQRPSYARREPAERQAFRRGEAGSLERLLLSLRRNRYI